MGRITRNHMLSIGIVVFAVGLVITAISWTWKYADDLIPWYGDVLDVIPGQSATQDWNVLFQILGPILLITGGFYAGEQLLLRRRFERMIVTTKKSEFVSHRKDLDDLAKRLPTTYRRRIESKEESFKSVR